MEDDPSDDDNHVDNHAMMIEQAPSADVIDQHQQQQQEQQFQPNGEDSSTNAAHDIAGAAAAAAAAAPGAAAASGLLQPASVSVSGSALVARSSSLVYHQRYAGEGSNSSRGSGGGGGDAGNTNSSSEQHQQIRYQASSYAGASGASTSLYAAGHHYGGRFGLESSHRPFSSVPERDTEHEEEFSPTLGWSQVELSQDGTPPSARSLHAAAILNGTMFVFGGYDGNQRVNTFHAFNFAEKRWNPVLPAAGSASPPSPRDRHVAVAFGNSVYIHGGFDGVSRLSNFFSFDLGRLAWREVHAVNGRAPSPRHSHSGVVRGSSFYVFGGYDGSYKNDMYSFDFEASTWAVVPAAGRRPSPRYRASACVHKSSMVVYGGHDGTRHLSDVHIFDFDTRVWNGLVCDGVPPSPRDSHVSVMHGNCMYVFGGSSGSAMNDFHELHLVSMSSENPVAKWRTVVHASAAADQPRPRFCHVGVVFSDSFYVHGGYDGSDRLVDFLRFDFSVYDMSVGVPAATILHDLRSLVNQPALSDITFIVEDQPIHAHKLLLMRSSYFQALFLGSMRESSLDTIRLEQVRYPVFLAILEYLYTDQLIVSLGDAMELFEAADLFCIPRLKTMCEKRILQSITVSNAAAVFHAADVHSAAALRQKSKKYILAHFEEVSKSASFEVMGRKNVDLIFELLQSR